MPHNRIKRIHFSESDAKAIVCGVAKNDGWKRVRFTKVRGDITCTTCLKCLDAREGMLGESLMNHAMDQAKKIAATFYRQRFEALFRNLGVDPATCRGCGRTIWWIAHANGKRAPYTIDGQNHFASCPQAHLFRKKK